MFNCNTPRSITIQNTLQPVSRATAAMDSLSLVKGKMQAAFPILDVHVMHDGYDTCVIDIVPPDSGESPCLDICVVMDVSGSMGDAANPNGPEGINQFTKLDLAKRGVEVLMLGLRDCDTLRIIGFSSDVSNVLPRTPMDSVGRSAAQRALGGMHPGGGTALWDGLYAGLYETEVAAPTPDHRNRNRAAIPVVILLTDGQPSHSPPSGEAAELRRYVETQEMAKQNQMRQHARLTHAKLFLMGFGYDINSKLLAELTSVHHVSDAFCFIPDGTMVLTTFTNLTATLMSLCARHITLALPVAMASCMDMVGDVPMDYKSSNTHARICIGDMMYGQPRQIVLRCKPGTTMQTLLESTLQKNTAVPIRLDYYTSMGAPISQPLNVTLSDFDHQPSQVAYHKHRALAIVAMQQALRIATTDLDSARSYIKTCVLNTEHARSGTQGGFDPHPILEDLMGEVSSALGSSDAWTRWGAHYLRALVSAHKGQTCTNFKDPGLAAYGGSFTKELKDTYNTLCDGLPVPVPSRRSYATQWGVPVGGAGGGGAGIPVISASVFQQAFNNQYGGCVAHGTFIRTGENREVPVQSLCKGDTVLVPGMNGGGAGGMARVRCVVASKGVKTVPLTMPEHPYPMPLGITPWHPVRMSDGSWRFPADLVSDATMQEPHEGTVYTLVLDAGHVVLANGIPILTLGHGFQDPIAKHDFYGTQDVLDALAVLDGWEQGWVQLGNRGEPVKDDTGKMIGFVPAYI